MAFLVQEMLHPQLVSNSSPVSRLLVGKERRKGEKNDSPFLLFLPSFSFPFLSYFPSSEWVAPKIPAELSPRAPRVQSLLPRFLYSHCHVERWRYSLSVRLLSARGWYNWSFQTKPGSASWSWGSQITTARCEIIMDWNVWKRFQLWPIQQQKRKLEEFCFDLLLKRTMSRLNLVFF